MDELDQKQFLEDVADNTLAITQEEALTTLARICRSQLERIELLEGKVEYLQELSFSKWYTLKQYVRWHRIGTILVKYPLRSQYTWSILYLSKQQAL